jgi:hypothetical protein
MTIHDPDVVFTDLGLALLGGFFAWRLGRDAAAGRGMMAHSGVLIMAGLASAAFWGAIFHAFFPAKTATTAGFVIWLLVAFSIALVAESLLALALLVLTPGGSPGKHKLRRGVVLGYCLLFAFFILFIDESFTTVVRFYGPVLVLMLVAAMVMAFRTGSRAWAFIAVGLGLSAIAALLQQAKLAIHPVYFDHNAVYHVLQAAALVVLYFGFRDRRTDPAVRA